MSNMEENRLEITIITPESKQEKIIATSLIVPLQDGYWGILPKHINMVSTLSTGKITIKTEEGNVHFKVNDGWMEVFHNRVIILTSNFDRLQ